MCFTPVFRLPLTGRQYVIPFDLRSEDVQDPLIRARNMTAKIKWNVEHMNASYQVVSSLKRTL